MENFTLYHCFNVFLYSFESVSDLTFQFYSSPPSYGYFFPASHHIILILNVWKKHLLELSWKCLQFLVQVLLKFTGKKICRQVFPILRRQTQHIFSNLFDFHCPRLPSNQFIFLCSLWTGLHFQLTGAGISLVSCPFALFPVLSPERNDCRPWQWKHFLTNSAIHVERGQHMSICKPLFNFLLSNRVCAFYHCANHSSTHKKFQKERIYRGQSNGHWLLHVKFVR